MAATVNARDVLISGGTRTQAVTLPSDVNVSGNVTGTLNGIPVQDVIDAANSPATANYFTTSSSDPAGGSNGDAHYNSSTNVMWFKVGGAWQKGGTINASQITTGTLAAARIAASSITSDKLSVSTLSAITANLGSVNAGNITGSANITITGKAEFDGGNTLFGYNAAVHANGNKTATNGLVSFAPASAGVAIRADGGTGDNWGLISSTQGNTRPSVLAENTGSGAALDVRGKMVINNTTLVSNLNADMVDGYHQSSFCRFITCDSGSATVAGAGFQFNSYVSGTRTRGTGAQFMVEPTSDERLKQDIAPEPLGLEFISALKPVEYRLKENPSMKYHGFIAQDVAQLISATDDCLYQTHDDGMHGVDYVAIIAPLVNAVKELKRRIETLEVRS